MSKHRRSKVLKAWRPRETVVQAEIVARLSRMRGVRIWRNNRGAAKHDADPETGRKRRYVVFGLEAGGSDLIGIVIAGNGIGRYFAIECKRDEKEKPTESQARFLREVNRYGGYGIVAWSWQQAEAAVMAARAGEPAPPPPAAKPDRKPTIRPMQKRRRDAVPSAYLPIGM